MIVGSLSLISGNWCFGVWCLDDVVVDVCCLFFVARCLSFVVCGLTLSVVCCLMLGGCSLFVVCWLLLNVCRSFLFLWWVLCVVCAWVV